MCSNLSKIGVEVLARLATRRFSPSLLPLPPREPCLLTLHHRLPLDLRSIAFDYKHQFHSKLAQVRDTEKQIPAKIIWAIYMYSQ